MAIDCRAAPFRLAASNWRALCCGIDLTRGTRFRTEENKGTCACTHGKGEVTDGYKATVDAVTKVLISEGAQAEFLHRANEEQQPRRLDRDPYHAA